MTNDPIADFITRLINAGSVGKETVVMPYSILKHRIADLLVKEGYVEGVEKEGKKADKKLIVTLSYKDGKPRIHEAKRVSKPSRRLYTGADTIGSIKGGRGMYVLSTSQGVMSDRQARKEHVGGEILFSIW